MNLEVGKKVLITTQEFFVAPDGLQYKSVLGSFMGVHSSEELLSNTETYETPRKWYLRVGSMMIPESQVNSIVITEEAMLGGVKEYLSSFEKNGYTRPSFIYNADVCEISFGEGK